MYQLPKIAVALVLLLASTAPVWAQLAKPEKISGDEVKSQQKEMKATSMDLSEVYVVRVMIDGKRRDLTTLQPEVLGKAGDGADAALSTGGFSSDRSSLVLLTLDPRTGAGTRLVIPITKLQKKAQFRFPVLSADGKLKSEKFEVVEVRHLP
jgi:hypothetical protein